MLMELQGKKASAHDFLLIYNKDSRPPPLSRGRPLTTHDFLGSLERVEPAGGEAAIGGGGGAERPAAAAAEHVLPGGIGTYSITHVSVLPPSKHELGTCPDRSKPEPHSNGLFAQALPPWGPDPVANGTGSTGRWPPPIAGRSNHSLTPPPPPSMHQPAPDKRRFTMTDSIPVKSFPDVSEEDEEEYLKVEMNAMIDGKGKDQKQPNTPRSKHSATEQRRRSKINDRFQILRDLIPHSDQKRDKASFLLEVIEYIRFLQEKVHKYEEYPGWNQENAKVVPWNQLPVESITDHPEFMKAGLSPPGYMFSGKFDDSSVSIPTVILANSQNLTESELSASVPYNGIDAPVFSSKEAAIPASMQTNLYASVVGKAAPHADKMAYQSQSQWLRSPYPAECTVSSATLNEQEDPSIDEGALSVSRAYSQELLTTLSQSLQSSGIDASISVQINLGKRVIGGHTTTATLSTPKDQNDLLLGGRVVGPSRVGSSRDDSEPSLKRHKSNK